jgi:hypothetical protein
MMYAKAATLIFAASLMRCLGLPTRWVWAVEDRASTVMHACSLDFIPVEWPEPTGWGCDHVSVASERPGVVLDVTSPCGCEMRPLYS